MVFYIALAAPTSTLPISLLKQCLMLDASDESGGVARAAGSRLAGARSTAARALGSGGRGDPGLQPLCLVNLCCLFAMRCFFVVLFVAVFVQASSCCFVNSSRSFMLYIVVISGCVFVVFVALFVAVFQGLQLLYYAMLCYAMLCYAMLCYAMLCYAMLCYAILLY